MNQGLTTNESKTPAKFLGKVISTDRYSSKLIFHHQISSQSQSCFEQTSNQR